MKNKLEIENINELEELLGKEKVVELFFQHYIKYMGQYLNEKEKIKL